MIRVMIVEDDPPTSALLTRIVKRTFSEVSVEVKADGFSALEHWRDVGADIVLLDWGLPGMSGLELLRLIRVSRRPVPCVMITGYSDRHKILAARAHQVDGYIVKPFEIQHVVDTLSSILTEHQPNSAQEEPTAATVEERFLQLLKDNSLCIPIDEALVKSIERLRNAEAEERIGVLRRCQGDTALLFRLLSLANSGEYIQGSGVVETFEGALRRTGINELTTLAVELSLYPGGYLKQDFLSAKRLEFQREAMSLCGIISKMRQHVEFDAAACRSACILYRAGELALLQVMQTWLDLGRPLDEATCTKVLKKHSLQAADHLRAQWVLPLSIRERIAALDTLPEGVVRREPLIMRIASLLNAGDKGHELPRLLGRFGLKGGIMGA